MRLHRNLVAATVRALHQIFNENKAADKVLQSTLKQDKRWGARDRAFIAETTYDIVRNKRLYSEIAQIYAPYKTESLFYLVAIWAILKEIDLPNWELFKNIPIQKVNQRFESLSKKRRILHSIPDWLDELGTEEMGVLWWEKELAALNEQAQVVLRCNTLLTNREMVQRTLQQEGIETYAHATLPNALILKERKNVFLTTSFKQGFFEVQDASSQEVARLLNPKPKMRVIDTCAGAGGKSLHMASLMQNKGQIIALDIFEHKLKELKKRAKRNKAHNIETRVIEGTKTYKKFFHKMDRVLIDAPCSGLGVLKRNPDTKWKLTPEFLSKIKETQQQILKTYSSFTKDGGSLVYATCSILPSENELQVNDFLASESGKDFTLVSEKTLYPSETGFDGFYMALLQKNK